MSKTDTWFFGHVIKVEMLGSRDMLFLGCHVDVLPPPESQAQESNVPSSFVCGCLCCLIRNLLVVVDVHEEHNSIFLIVENGAPN